MRRIPLTTTWLSRISIHIGISLSVNTTIRIDNAFSIASNGASTPAVLYRTKCTESTTTEYSLNSAAHAIVLVHVSYASFNFCWRVPTSETWKAVDMSVVIICHSLWWVNASRVLLTSNSVPARKEGRHMFESKYNIPFHAAG